MRVEPDSSLEAAIQNWAISTAHALTLAQAAVLVSAAAGCLHLVAALMRPGAAAPKSFNGEWAAIVISFLVCTLSVFVVTQLRRYPQGMSLLAIGAALIGLSAMMTARFSDGGAVVAVACLLWLGYGIPLILCAVITLAALRRAPLQAQSIVMQAYSRLAGPSWW